MAYVHPSILEEIDAKKMQVDSESTDSGISGAIRLSLEKEALNHSEGLELGKTRLKVVRRRKKTALMEAKRYLGNSWDYALSNFKGEVTEELILGIGQRVDDTANNGAYRDGNVRIQGTNAVLPPRAEKVRLQMDKLLEFVNDSDLHPVERAGLLHLHFVRVHPLFDGNGRTARLLQNLVLNYEGYAPADIEVSERILYQTQLRDALRGYAQRESVADFEEAWSKSAILSHQEGNFLNYIGTKVSMGMDNLTRAIERLPEYIVHFKGSKIEPGHAISVKRGIESYFRKGDRVGQVRVAGKKGPLKIRGNVDYQTLKRIIDKTSKLNYILKKNK